jgi:hypothetical protein
MQFIWRISKITNMLIEYYLPLFSSYQEFYRKWAVYEIQVTKTYSVMNSDPMSTNYHL